MEFERANPEANIRAAVEVLTAKGLVKQGDPLVILSDALYAEANIDAIFLREV